MIGDDERTRWHHATRRAARAYASRVVQALGGEVSDECGQVLYRIGLELGHDACKTLADEISKRIAEARQARPTEPLTVEITRGQLECWAERPLLDDEVTALDACIPDSTIPHAIADMADAIRRQYGTEETP